MIKCRVLIALSLFFVAMSASASPEVPGVPEVNVTFVNPQQLPTSVLRQRGAKVLVDVKGFSSEEVLYANLWIRPVGSSQQDQRLALTDWKLTPNEQGQGHYFWKVSFPSDGFEPQALPLWQVQVQWRTQSGLAGVASDVVYLAGPKARPYFEVLGEKICSFPGPLAATSRWMANTSGYEQEIALEVPRGAGLNTMSGLDFLRWGNLSNSSFRVLANASVYGPLGGATNGWFFPGWNQVVSQIPGPEVHRTWRLFPGVSGVIGERWMYHRMKVRQWTASPSGWVSGRTGLLDVAVKENGFYVLPTALGAEDPLSRRVSQALNDAYSGSGFCGKNLSELQAHTGAEVLGNDGEETPVYFYPDSGVLR
ncbi:hypothetical protein WDW37_02960 [Bdellovibrionota bacterium FG-1]